MNLQEQVALRRAERERLDRLGEEEAEAAKRAVATAAQAQREQAVEALADEFRLTGLPVQRTGEDIAFVPPSTESIDVAGLRSSKLRSLLDREARRRWTPGENWLVISLIVGGVTLIHLGGLGIIPLVIGVWRRNVLMERYKKQVLADHPQLAELMPATN